MTSTPVPLIKTYTKGDRVMSGDLNGIVDALKEYSLMLSPESYSRTSRKNWGMFLKNTTASTAPPGATLAASATVIDVSDDVGLEAHKRTSTDYPAPMLTLDLYGDVVQNGFQHCRWGHEGVWALYDHATDGAPSFGSRWGVESGAWLLSKGASCDFISLGNYFQVGSNYYGRFVQDLRLFAVLNEDLTSKGTATAETLTGAGVRTGFEYEVTDIFLNTADTCEEGTVIATKYYDQKNVVDAMYCNINDWL